MAVPLTDHEANSYFGLRMTADEYLTLPESPLHWELVDGVVVLSPSPSFWHQEIAGEILFQITTFLESRPLGKVVFDIDVKLRDNLVYRPDIVFLSAPKAAHIRDRITVAPDLVVEVISPGSRSYDSQTKRSDYAAAGVAEYWLIDPQRQSQKFFVLENGAYREREAAGERYAAHVLPGFQLDLSRIRRLF